MCLIRQCCDGLGDTQVDLKKIFTQELFELKIYLNKRSRYIHFSRVRLQFIQIIHGPERKGVPKKCYDLSVRPGTKYHSLGRYLLPVARLKSCFPIFPGILLVAFSFPKLFANLYYTLQVPKYCSNIVSPTYRA